MCELLDGCEIEGEGRGTKRVFNDCRRNRSCLRFATSFLSLPKTQSRSLFALYRLSFPTIFLFFILIPAYYILVILAIMITLSMHHHPLSRWEQPVAICGSPSRHSFHITTALTGHLPVNAQMNIGVLFERYERNIMSSGGGYALCWIRRSCEATIDLILSGRDCSII